MATEKKYNLVINCETGEQTQLEYTAEQYAQAEAEAIAFAEAEALRETAEAEAAAKKAAVLEALATAAGLTVEEVSVALG